MRVETDAGSRLRTVLADAPVLPRGPRRAADTNELVDLDDLLEDLDPRDAEGGEPDEPVTDPAGAPAPVPLVRRVTARHLQAIGLVAVVVLVAVTMHLMRARPEQVPLVDVAADPLVSASAAAAASSAAPPSYAPQKLLVHVIGEVLKPGVVTLPAGARVIDAIDAAGGPTPRANLGALNLASPLGDGMQVVVGGPGATSTMVAPEGAPQSQPPGVAPVGGAPNGDLVNLNTATQAQFESLPGVGPIMAGKILAWREEHGQFTRVEELQEVSGIGAKTFERLKPHVTV